jgi:N-acetylglucosaminyl-diphospho-decaprenol L-rhamnosyltransferase
MEADKLQPAAPAAARSAPPALGEYAASVDVVIVSADMGAMTLQCIGRLDSPAIASVVVVDNAFGAEPGVGDAREQIAARADVVALDRPHGFAAANNRGLRHGGAPFALLLNSDVLVVAGAVETLLRALAEQPHAVAAGGRLVDPQTLATQQQYRPRPFPTLANFLVIVLGIEELWPANPVTRRYHGAATTTAEDDVSVRAVAAQPAAAALLVRRDVMDAVGGFDERFWFWFEDSDLLLRLAARGSILYAPGAVFRHLGGGSFSRWSKAAHIRSIHHGIVQYADAHFSRPRRAALGLAELAVSLPRVALFHSSRPQEAAAWRSVAGAGVALLRGRRPAAIAPGPETPRP